MYCNGIDKEGTKTSRVQFGQKDKKQIGCLINVFEGTVKEFIYYQINFCQ